MNKPAILGGKPAFDRVVPFVKPLLPDYSNMENDLKSIFQSGMLTKGSYLKKYEKNLAAYIGVEEAVGVSSCTMGLIVVLKCLDLKGEVIVPSFTFPSTVHAIIWNNLKPVFVDCDPNTFNVLPSEVEKAITEHTSAIMAVHIFGNPAETGELEKIAKKHNLRLIFDCAHGFGSLADGKPLGNSGEVEVFSTSPTKLLVTGEGGVITTNNKDLAQKMRTVIEYGNPGDYDCTFVGVNARLSEINSLIGINSLEQLEENAQKRNYLAELYKKYLSEIPGITFQKIRDNCRSSYKDFAILLGKDSGLSRDILYKALEAEGIITRKYFYPNHSQKALQYMSLSHPLPFTDDVYKKVLCIPMYYSLRDEDVKRITEVIYNIYSHKDEIKNI